MSSWILTHNKSKPCQISLPKHITFDKYIFFKMVLLFRRYNFKSKVCSESFPAEMQSSSWK